MALPDRKTNPLCHFLDDGAGNWYIVPLNSEAKDAVDAAFTADGALTTVALTQEDAGKGGYGQTSGYQQAVKVALS